MQLLSVLMFLLVSYLYIWQTCEAYYSSWTHRRFKHKLFAMMEELTIDAIVRRASINHYKRYYDQSTAFQVAEYAYKVKEKYLRMVYIYTRCNENMNDYYKVPTVQRLLWFLLEMQHIQRYIDNFILMLEEWEDRDTRKKRITRTGDSVPLPNARRNRKLQQDFPDIEKLNISQEQISKIKKSFKENYNFLSHLALGSLSSQNLQNQLFNMKSKWQDDEHLMENVVRTSRN